MKHLVGLIRVLTITDEKMLNIHGKLIESMFPELKIISTCIEDQPKGIYDHESEEIAKPKILKMAKELVKNGVEAIIISCAADPAVDETRKALKIPVIGAGSAVASLSLAYGNRIGVLNMAEETPKIVKKILGEHLVAEDKPRGVKNTLDLMTNWGMTAAEEALKRLVEHEIDAIVLACTGYSTIGFAKIAKRITNVPVLDPVIAAGAITLSILRQKSIGGFN